MRNDLEFAIKDIECEKEKLETKIKNLQKELIKTGTVEEQVITEIVNRENMRYEYDTIVNSMKDKQEILVKEKEDNLIYYEKKIGDLTQSCKDLEEIKLKYKKEIKDWKGNL